MESLPSQQTFEQPKFTTREEVVAYFQQIFSTEPDNLDPNTIHKFKQLDTFQTIDINQEDVEWCIQALIDGKLVIILRNDGNGYYHGCINKRKKKHGIGRWCHSLNKEKQFKEISEGWFNEQGYRDGYSREVYFDGFYYAGNWDNGV